MITFSECALLKIRAPGKPTRFKFACRSFFAPSALCTGFLTVKSKDDGRSFQTSIRITNDIDGLFGYNVVLPGPEYTTTVVGAVACTKKIATYDAAHVLFALYVKLISNVRQLYFERVLHVTSYRELCFDRLSGVLKRAAIRAARVVPELDTRVVTRATTCGHRDLTVRVKHLMLQNVNELARAHAYVAVAPPPPVEDTARKKRCTADRSPDTDTNTGDECFLCMSTAADVCFPCSRHFACGPCVRKWWKSTTAHVSEGTIACPFCRGAGAVEKLRYRDSGEVYALPLYRLRNTANVNYDESEDAI